MNLEKILLAESGLEKIMGDIIRVLSLCMGALWIGELYMEMDAFYKSMEEEPPEKESVEKALHRLEDLDIITLMPRIRATEDPRGEETILVKLLNYSGIMSRVRRDNRLADYLNRYKKALEGY